MPTTHTAAEGIISEDSTADLLVQTAVMFHCWGPYHLARLQKAAEIMPIVGIEVFGQSSEYAWEPVVNDASVLRRVTVFPNMESRQLPCSIVRRKVAECLDELGPRCVAIPGWSATYSLAALYWCTTNRVPAVLMGDSTASDGRRTWASEWPKKHVVAAFSTALAAGTAARDYFCQLGMPEDRVFLGYNAVDNAYFQRSAEHCRKAEQSLRTELTLEHPFFLLVGRFIPEKNLFRLLAAYAKYRQLVTNPWDLVLLGDGGLMPQIRQSIQELNLQESVSLSGFAQYTDLPKYYALAECLILPSQKDTWGLVVNEAMANGLPVIVSERCGCSADLVEDARNGFLMDPYSVDDMAKKMLKMTRLSETERKSMGQRSREIIADWDTERFALGLKAAVGKALEVGPKQVSASDRLLLKFLTLR